MPGCSCSHIHITIVFLFGSCLFHAVTKEAKYKCDIYMVFDYAEHDLTGLMDATRSNFLRPDQVISTAAGSLPAQSDLKEAAGALQ